MKKTFLWICAVFVVLVVSMTGCGPSEKDIAEKKQLEAKVAELEAQVAELENKLLEVAVVENTKTAIEEFLKTEAPPESTIKCTSVLLNEKTGQHEWLAEGEVLAIIPGMASDFAGLTGIRVTYNPENQSVKSDFSNIKPKQSAEQIKTICLSNLKQLGLELQMYAMDHDEKFPDAEGFKELVESGDWKSVGTCPGDGKPYTYIPGLRETSKGDLPIAYCKYHHKNGEFLLLRVMGSAGYGTIPDSAE